MTAREAAALAVGWNIQFGRAVDAAIAAFREVEELRAPDVVFLQEMDEPGTRAVAEALELHHAYAAATVHPKTGRDFGNAILSAAPLDDVEVVALPHVSGPQVTPRVALWAHTTVGDRAVDVCSVHTETPVLSARKRVEQFVAVAAAAEVRRSRPVLVGGDFNTATRRSVERLTARMGSVGLERLSARSGWGVARGPGRFELDHLFGRGVEVRGTGVVRGLGASDHAPLWVRLAVVDPAEGS